MTWRIEILIGATLPPEIGEDEAKAAAKMLAGILQMGTAMNPDFGDVDISIKVAPTVLKIP